MILIPKRTDGSCPEGENIAILLHFLDVLSVYLNTVKWTAGEGEDMHLPETMMLASICHDPGCTVTSLAKQQHRTKSYISQLVSKMVRYEMVYKKRLPEAPRFLGIYPTEKGKRAAAAFEERLCTEYAGVIKILSQFASSQEIDHFFKVMKVYGGVMKDYLTFFLDSSFRAPAEEPGAKPQYISPLPENFNKDE